MPDSWNLPVSSSTPALDFLRRVEVWQQAPGGTAGIAVTMPEGDEVTLHQLLGRFQQGDNSRQLERQARTWLIGYREMQPPLSSGQAAQLDAVIDGLPKSPPIRIRPWKTRFLVRYVLGSLLGVALALGLVSAGRAIWSATHPGNPVQHGAQSQPYAPPQQVPPGSTDLQNFESDWGPFRQLAVSDQNSQTGAPAVLLLNQGGYYATRWQLPGGKADWTADLGGNVQGVDVHGHYADITDADGNPWVVGIDQPFVFAANPGTVLKIDPVGTVLSTTESHATAIRIRL